MWPLEWHCAIVCGETRQHTHNCSCVDQALLTVKVLDECLYSGTFRCIFAKMGAI